MKYFFNDSQITEQEWQELVEQEEEIIEVEEDVALEGQLSFL